MPIQIQCPNCQARHQVNDNMAGKRAKCRCGAAIQIPAQGQAVAPARAVPAPQPTALAPFKNLSDDEMDDLYGSSPQPDALGAGAAAVPNAAPPPANMVGAEQTKAPVEDPNAPKPVTGKDRRIAIMGIVAGFFSVPMGITLFVIMLLFLFFSMAGPPVDDDEAGGLMDTVPRLANACLTLGALGMIVAGIAVPIHGFNELKGRLPKSNMFYLFGTFAPLLIIAGVAINSTLTAVTDYDDDVKAAEDEIRKEMGGSDEKIVLNYAPLLLRLILYLFLAFLKVVGMSIIPGFQMYVCRAHTPPKKPEEPL